MLFAERGSVALALACDPPWLDGSAGFVGTSDGWQELATHKYLRTVYGRAENGNVALTRDDLRMACDGRHTREEILAALER